LPRATRLHAYAAHECGHRSWAVGTFGPGAPFGASVPSEVSPELPGADPKGTQMPMIHEFPADEGTAPASESPVVQVRRRTIDTVLVGLGAVTVAVLLVAGGLLTWGSNFATDYVRDELSSQQIFFPDRAALEEDGRADLVQYAGEQVTTGEEAEAYASFIDGHLANIADGATYSELGETEGAAKAAVQAAKDNGESEATVAELQAEADGVTAQRNTLFKGETLRGLLLSTFAWSTIGRIAGIAATAAFVGAGVMLVLVVLGAVHRRRAA